MKFHVLTLFPEMIEQGLNSSIIGRAVEGGLLSVNAVDIRDYTTDKHGKVDDYTYGGGAGMLIQAQPVYDTYKSVCGEKKLRTIYVTPQGRTFHQGMAEEFAKEEELVFLCGHYEGVDERVLEEIVTDYVSIGDYVLTGGELPAMVMIDAISRLIPGVLNNDVSAETESFHNNLLEYPQYSRPEVWMGKAVPPVLLSGNHKKITQWRLEQSKERTKRTRPDLYEKYLLSEELIKRLSKQKRNHIHMMEMLANGSAEPLYHKGRNILLYNKRTAVCMLTADNEKDACRMADLMPAECRICYAQPQFAADFVQEKWNVERAQRRGAGDGMAEVEENNINVSVLVNACYTLKDAMPIRHKDIRRVDNGENAAVYGAYVEDVLVGHIVEETDGKVGLPQVLPAYQGGMIEDSLEAFVINKQKEKGRIPYLQVPVSEEENIALQEKLGLYVASEPVWQISR